METLWSSAIVAALISASFAFWSAANSARHQKEIETLKVKLDKARKVYELHVKFEYEIYGTVYRQLVGALDEFSMTHSVDAEPSTLELLSSKGIQRTEREIREMRETQLQVAFDKLTFVDEIRVRKPFVAIAVYSAIEKFFEMGRQTWSTKRFPDLNRPPIFDSKPAHTHEQLEAQLDVICDAIRRQLGLVED